MAPLKDKKRRKKSKKQQLKEINNALQTLYARREEIDKDIRKLENQRTELETALISDDDDDAAAAATAASGSVPGTSVQQVHDDAAGGSVAGPSVQITKLEKRSTKLDRTASGSVAGSSLQIHDNDDDDDDKDAGGSVYGTSLLLHEDAEPVAGTRERRQVAYNVVPEKPGLDLRPTLCVSKKSPINNPSDYIMNTDHSKLIRCIDFLPTHPEQFVTSDNAGSIQKWRLIDTMLEFNASHHQLFPYAISVNPFDDTLIAVYGPNEKLAVASLREDYELGEEKRFRLIEDEPHEAGVYQVAFMPWRNSPTFMSCGKYHDMLSWGLIESEWKSNWKYKSHTARVTGICGSFDRPWVTSVGKDKRICVWDLQAGSKIKEKSINEKILGVAANPSDYNLVCIQTSEQNRRLSLYDVRKGYNDHVQEFGWEYANTNNRPGRRPDDPKSALVRPSWSSSGLSLSCGSAESSVKVFDIRCNPKRIPPYNFTRHQHKVHQVAFSPAHSVLATTSNDRRIGLLRWKGQI